MNLGPITRTLFAYRVAMLSVAVFVALSLSIIYSVGIILPSPAGASIWIVFSVLFLLNLRANAIPILSLSFSTVGFYVYVAIMFLWPIIYPQVLISLYSQSFQTAEIFAQANHLIAVGMASFFAGWLVAFSRTRPARPSTRRTAIMPSKAFPFLVALSLPLIILSFPTKSILTSGYSGAPMQDTVGALLELNIIKPALYICLLFALASLMERPSLAKEILLVTLAATSILFGFAGGTRAEEIGFLFGVGWILQRHRADKKMPRNWLAVSAVLAILMLILGEVRGALPTETISFNLFKDSIERASQVIPTSETLQMKPSNNGDIALTLCVVLGLIDTGALQIDHGDTFLKYAQMTLPRFANPNRPVELQVSLLQSGRTGGGLYVLAEPVLAGGVWGVLLVLALFGWAVGHLEQSHVLGRGKEALYLLLISCVPRWLLYSSLSMYKHLLTGALIFMLARAASRLTVAESALGLPGMDYQNVANGR